MTIGQVAELWRYPVKSLGGERLAHAEVGVRGFLGDRLWAVRDLEHDITASARRLPKLLTAVARYTGPVPSDAGPAMCRKSKSRSRTGRSCPAATVR
jgi:uncharacterized protein YcbX